jgi:hypothetical protein
MSKLNLILLNALGPGIGIDLVRMVSPYNSLVFKSDGKSQTEIKFEPRELSAFLQSEKVELSINLEINSSHSILYVFFIPQ